MKQAATITTELQATMPFEQDELVFWQDPLADENSDKSGIRVTVDARQTDSIARATYQVSDLSNNVTEVPHQQLRYPEKHEVEAWYDMAQQHLESPFEKGDVVIWEDPARDPSEWSLYHVSVVPDVRDLSPEELLTWTELMPDQEFLIKSPEGSEAGVYPHEIRKPTEEEISAYFVENGGERCPFCFQGSVEGDSVTIVTGAAHQEASCYECNGEWTAIYTLTDCGILR